MSLTSKDWKGQTLKIGWRSGVEKLMGRHLPFSIYVRDAVVGFGFYENKDIDTGCDDMVRFCYPNLLLHAEE
jgi:hypothetical protein